MLGFDSPSIIRFLEPLTSDVFTARFTNCHFDETVFPSLGTPKSSTDDKRKKAEIFSWNEKSLSHLDPRAPECENEVRRLIHVQAIANKMPNAFNETARVKKSHILAVNVPARIEVPVELTKMDRSGPKDTVPRKRRGRNPESAPDEPIDLSRGKEIPPEVLQNLIQREHIALEVAQTYEKITNPGNTEISMNYCNEIWDRNEIIINDAFALSVAHEIKNDDYEPRSITECRQRQYWPKWEEAIRIELTLQREVFGPITKTPDNIKPVGFNGSLSGNEMRRMRSICPEMV
ncbi:hypothetical protein CCACVL1_25460 [Corchorus capsularis]|uniref:Uncharacterized protein n=1 Tax=Corchorus capsularis TaxID=210143 RepID=A0A1R3GK38_COCAP|nr:hypothetical protein CCACVL1_25460 [Corchorus capsularis]